MITLILSSGLGKNVPSPSATITTEEKISVEDPLRSVDYFSINFLSPMSLRDIVNQYPKMFTRESHGLGRRFMEKLQPGPWLVRKDGVKSFAALVGDRCFGLSTDVTSISYREIDRYESQKKLIPSGDEVLPVAVVAGMAIIHHLKTGEWMMGLAQNSLRCAETHKDCFGVLQRLCVSLDPNRTKLVLMGFSDEISDAHLTIATGHKGPLRP
jgi:hypothetical protein